MVNNPMKNSRGFKIYDWRDGKFRSSSLKLSLEGNNM